MRHPPKWKLRMQRLLSEFVSESLLFIRNRDVEAERIEIGAVCSAVETGRREIAAGSAA